jgi:hypothetical protein
MVEVRMLQYMVIAADPHYAPDVPLQHLEDLSAVRFHR